MSESLLSQRKITIGPKGAPTYIGAFHNRYGDEEQSFHSYCSDHADFGTCGTQEEARGAAKAHLRQAHGELLPVGSLMLTEDELEIELSYRLRTVAALALSRGKHGEKLPEGFIEREVGSAVSALKTKSEK